MRTPGTRFSFGLMVCASLCVLLHGCEKKDAGGFKETRVPVKTSLPPGTDPTQARKLTFAQFASIPDPPEVLKNDPRYDKARIPAFANSLGVKEGDVVKVGGYLQVVTYMGDGDYNLRFTATPDSPDNYIVSEVPDDDDLADKKLRPLVIAARDALKAQALGGKDPSKQGSKPTTPPYMEITGQLYFSDNHVGDAPAPDRQGLHRASSWQIHPGLYISFPAKPTQ
jgi:hypothetical protein